MIALVLTLTLFTGCQCSKQKQESSVSTGSSQGPSELVQKGKSIYLANCIACHNTNPSLAGSLGPEVAKSSRALLEARIVQGGYPTDYKPKRSSHLMQPLPHLAKDLDALDAYLNSL